MTKYQEFIEKAKEIVSTDRVYTDQLRRLAWGTDAGFYRLVPQVVVRAASEAEVSALLKAATDLQLPVTFRAAGTSLSGQAITDSILILANKEWEDYKIIAGADSEAAEIQLQPGIIGQRVNEILAPYKRMFSPDPASKGSAMVGGIVMNNASGMNCGTHANSDKIMSSMRVVLADGTVIDTAEPSDNPREVELMRELEAIRDDVRADNELVERIRYKYSIKNVTGLNLLPFVEYDDPREILAHAMVGSEGTLAFMSRVTVRTAHLYPHSASALVYFREMRRACEAVVALKPEKAVYSCEMFDKKSLSSVNDDAHAGMTALLIETRADDADTLAEQMRTIEGILAKFETAEKPEFTIDPKRAAAMWQMRSGIFPAVGGTRPAGTTSLIEDIAFHIDDLPQATSDLAELLEECGYDDACIYGHALEGNYHFVIAQAFDTQAEIDRYAHLMKRIEELVVDKYDGSLKAEHGTGRNMAPFVAKEWGDKAWQIMKRIKQAFDPDGLLNPGVIFNDDPQCYIRNLKPLPLTNPKVDKCIECGFCEVNCVSCGLTLSARQRIVTQREISRLRATGEDPERLSALEREFRYYGNQTCAGDGLCSTSCPMKINTGEMIHDIRHAVLSPTGYKIGNFAADHLNGIRQTLRPVLYLADVAHRVLGDKATAATGRALHRIGLPLWTPSLPAAAPKPAEGDVRPNRVVYFPSCLNRTFGASHQKGEPKDRPLTDVMVELCNKAGYEVIYPKDMKRLCCGMIWDSKGMPDIAERKVRELEKALIEASEGGRYPVLCDQSPCLHRMREHISAMKLYEPAEFIATYLAPNLEFHPTDEPVAVHVTCSSRLMGLAETIIDLCRRCSSQVIVPAEVGCCGFAGDKGFTHPELNSWGLRKLRPQIAAAGVRYGYSNSRTCEIGLTTNSGIPYRSIAYLVNQVTTKKQ